MAASASAASGPAVQLTVTAETTTSLTLAVPSTAVLVGPVDVAIVAPNRLSARATVRFLDRQASSGLSAFPSSGPVTGGTTVQLRTNFPLSSAMSVRAFFGDAEVPVLTFSQGPATVVAPAGAGVGTVTVLLVDPVGFSWGATTYMYQ